MPGVGGRVNREKPEARGWLHQVHRAKKLNANDVRIPKTGRGHVWVASISLSRGKGVLAPDASFLQIPKRSRKKKCPRPTLCKSLSLSEPPFPDLQNRIQIPPTQVFTPRMDTAGFCKLQSFSPASNCGSRSRPHGGWCFIELLFHRTFHT